MNLKEKWTRFWKGPDPNQSVSRELVARYPHNEIRRKSLSKRQYEAVLKLLDEL